MLTGVLAIDVKGPVAVEVTACAEGPQAQYGLCARERLARAGLLHAILDEVAARALDDARGDRQTGCQRIVVREVVPHALEVPKARRDTLSTAPLSWRGFALRRRFARTFGCSPRSSHISRCCTQSSASLEPSGWNA